MKKFLIFIIIVLLLIVIAGGAFIYGTLQVMQMDTNYPGVSIEGISVSGLTKQQTKDTLSAKGWSNQASTPLVVSTLCGQGFEIRPSDAGLSVSVEEVVELAYAFGREGSATDNFFSYINCRLGRDSINIIANRPETNREVIGKYVDECIAAVQESLGETELSVEPENARLAMKKGAGQISIDRVGFINAVSEALEAGKTELRYEELADELVCPDFKALHDEIYAEAVPASFKDDGSFQIIDEVIGCEFDPSEAEKRWNEAEIGEEFEVPLDVTIPDVTNESLSSTLYCDLLGACTTYYPNSSDDRISNLKLATSKINGMIMYPGDVFAYNTVVGERTVEAGFKYAAAYVNGEEKEEIGGGACQVSSTLYSATLFAFLETVERENHYFAVSYLQMGTDATVTIPGDGGRAIDFKFRNNKSHPIKLVGYCDVEKRSITFEIWGTLEDGDYMPIEFDNSYRGQFPIDRIIDKAYPDRPGYVIRLTHETYSFSDAVGAGYRTLTWRHVYDENGELVFEEMTNLLNAAGQHTMDTYYFHNT